MVVHEFSHVLGCLITRVKIHRVQWFGTTEAFVQHDKPGASAGLVISMAPFIIGNALGFWFLHGAMGLFAQRHWLAVVFLWIGASTVLLSFPSLQDAQNTVQSFSDSYRKKLFGKNSLVAKLFWLVSVPFVFLPLFVLLAVFVLFNYFFVLRLGWLAGFLVFAAA